jgi:hypothetical protein
MEITSAHYEIIKSAIQAKFTPSLVDVQRTFIKAECPSRFECTSEYVEKRLRWDLLWLSVHSFRVCDNIYKYTDFTNVDLALKSIMTELGFDPI